MSAHFIVGTLLVALGAGCIGWSIGFMQGARTVDRRRVERPESGDSGETT